MIRPYFLGPNNGLNVGAPLYVQVLFPWQQIRQRQLTEKMSLVQSCKTYSVWSQQPLQQVAQLFQWVTFPANTGTYVYSTS